MCIKASKSESTAPSNEEFSRVLSEPLISSRRNPLVKRLRMLSSRPGRDAEGLLLLEGTHLLQELLWIGGQPTELIATEAWFDRHADLIQALDASVVWRRVTEEVLSCPQHRDS